MDKILRKILLCSLIIFPYISIYGIDNGSPLDKKITLSKKKESVYNLLREVSDLSEYMFVYDSEIINNNKVISIKQGTYTLREAIYIITGNTTLHLIVNDKYIIIQQKKPYLSFEGIVRDKDNKSSIAYTSIGIKGYSIGTITNQDGKFKITFPDSLKDKRIVFSQLGYESKELEINSLHDKKGLEILLKRNEYNLPEITIKPVDPIALLKSVRDSVTLNYPINPYYITGFYREGVTFQEQDVDLTEAVIKIYKTGCKASILEDQIKLLKMRHINNEQELERLDIKIKSGLQSCIYLDLIKDMPSFLLPEDELAYTQLHEKNTRKDIYANRSTSIGNSLVISQFA